MSIIIDSTSNSFSNSSGLSYYHNNLSSDGILLVCVGVHPDNDQQVSRITYADADLTKISFCQIENQVSTQVWYLTNPPSGNNLVDISLTDTTKIVSASVSYSNVNQTDTIFKERNGVGKGVSSIPVQSFMKISGLSFGVGATNSEESYVDNFFGSQQNVFDVTASGLGLRMQAISALGDMDLDIVPVLNQLTNPADWAVCIVGIDS